MALEPRSKNSDAPKCKTCGKREWRHVCGGLSDRIKAELSRKDYKRPIEPPPDTPEGRLLAAILKSKPRAKKPKKKSAPKQRRQAGVSVSKPARDSSRKTDDEVPGAQETHGQSSGLQQLSKPKTDRREYLRLKALERRAAQRHGLTLEEFRKLEGPTR